jgi:hypothetical protein
MAASQRFQLQLRSARHFASEKAFKAWRDLTMREEVTTIAADTSLEDPIVTLDVGGGGGGGKSDRRPAKRARG